MIGVTSSMVEHRTLNPLVPSSSLGLPIPSNLAMCGVFEFLLIFWFYPIWVKSLIYSCLLGYVWVMSDLLNDNFDPSLDKYKREALKPDSEIHTHDDISIAQLWEQYTNYKRLQLAPSTIAKDFDRVSIYIDRFPDLTLDDAVAVRDYLNLKTTPNHYQAGFNPAWSLL